MCPHAGDTEFPGFPGHRVPEHSQNGTTPMARLLASATRTAGSTEIIFLILQPAEIICYNKYLPRKPGGFTNKAGFAHRLPGFGNWFNQLGKLREHVPAV